MRELIIKCDRCGEVIEGRPYSIHFVQAVKRDDNSEHFPLRTEHDKLDLCENCIEDLLDVVHEFLQPEDVNEEYTRNDTVCTTEVHIEESQETETTGAMSGDNIGGGIAAERAEDTPELTKNKEESSKSKSKKTIDTGKIRALYEAGWTVGEIATDVGVSIPTVYKKLQEMRLKKGEQI
ncbi:MAG: hypothetical protein J6K99_07160 [Peptococcaceae bacterium]|nr:hypothetical protein [Peptococcaceae bacterium]